MLNRYRILYWLVFSVAFLGLMATVGGFFYINTLLGELPKFEKLENYEPSLITRLYANDGTVIKELYEENRQRVNLDSIPPHLIQALMATEDRDFYNHWGFNLSATLRAALTAVPRKLIGKSVPGASTITQQLARNLYNEIGFEKNIERKIKELLTAIQLENMYSKREILEMYLTQCYFGESAYGIQSGAQKFFKKDVSKLTIDESALLIAQLKAPTHYNPYKNPERAMMRRNQVMLNMVDQNYLSDKMYETLKKQPIKVSTRDLKNLGIGPYFTEYIRQELNKKNSVYNFDYLKDGLNVYTTLDARMQVMADSAIFKNLPKLRDIIKRRFKYDRANGLERYVQANYDRSRWDFKYKDKALLDSLAAEKLNPQVALIAINPQNGHILAMTGGTDFEETKFNRATQAWRQPGSVFKPIVYLTALDNGYNPATELLNQPVVVKNLDGTIWSPDNYDKKNMGGLVTFRNGLKQSLNFIAVRIITELVQPDEVISYAKKLGIDTRNLQPYPAISLGAAEIRPIDAVTSYAAIANKGTLIKPIYIQKITDKSGQLIEETIPEKSVAISPETAFLITDMMRDVVDHGTAISLRYTNNFTRDVAGKTGTSNSFTDAWFCGFTPQIACVVWVGLDDRSYKLGPQSTGSEMALPIWGSFMADVYKNIPMPKKTFEQPESVVELEICSDSKKPSGRYCPKTYKEKFNIKYQPTDKCDVHRGGSSHEDEDERGRY